MISSSILQTTDCINGLLTELLSGTKSKQFTEDQENETSGE